MQSIICQGGNSVPVEKHLAKSYHPNLEAQSLETQSQLPTDLFIIPSIKTWPCIAKLDTQNCHKGGKTYVIMCRGWDGFGGKLHELRASTTIVHWA